VLFPLTYDFNAEETSLYQENKPNGCKIWPQFYTPTSPLMDNVMVAIYSTFT